MHTIMKKFVMTLLLMLTMALSASAMSYEQARQQALFLTDKMAYELNLNEAQYEAAYEINLDYLMGVVTPDDLYGSYWRQRNLDLSYILLDWQYRSFCAAAYFYRPLYWNAGYWHFRIYAHYPHRDYFYFGHPTFVTVYRGGHSWRSNGGRSWYYGRRVKPHTTNNYFGMRDGFKRGDYGKGVKGHFGSSTQSRPSVGNNRHNGASGTMGNRVNGSEMSKNGNDRKAGFGGSRGSNARTTTSGPSDVFSPKAGSDSRPGSVEKRNTPAGSSFGGQRIGNGHSTTLTNSRGMIPSGSNRNSSMGGNRGSSTVNRSSGSSMKNSGPRFGSSSSGRSSAGAGKSSPAKKSGSSSGGKFGGRR